MVWSLPLLRPFQSFSENTRSYQLLQLRWGWTLNFFSSGLGSCWNLCSALLASKLWFSFKFFCSLGFIQGLRSCRFGNFLLTVAFFLKFPPSVAKCFSNPELLLLVYQLSKTAALCLSSMQIFWANWEWLLGEILVKCGYHLDCVPFFKDHIPSSFHLFFLVSSAFKGLWFIFYSRVINIINKMIGLIWRNLPLVQLDSSCCFK